MTDQDQSMTEQSLPALGVAWYEAVCAAGRVHGEPIPKDLVEVGGEKYRYLLNTTGEEVESVPPFTVIVYLCYANPLGDPSGFPAAILTPADGGFIAGDEDEFIEWCRGIRPEA